MTRPLIDVRDLVKAYGRHAAVDGLSFQVVPQTPPRRPGPARAGSVVHHDEGDHPCGADTAREGPEQGLLSAEASSVGWRLSTLVSPLYTVASTVAVLWQRRDRTPGPHGIAPTIDSTENAMTTTTVSETSPLPAPTRVTGRLRSTLAERRHQRTAVRLQRRYLAATRQYDARDRSDRYLDPDAAQHHLQTTWVAFLQR